MGSLVVVVAPPLLDAVPGIRQGQELRGIPALGPQASVERLDEGADIRLRVDGLASLVRDLHPSRAAALEAAE
jgi:hypothetical protein